MICCLIPHTPETASHSVSLLPITFGTSLHAAALKRFRESQKISAALSRFRGGWNGFSDEVSVSQKAANPWQK